MEELADKRNGNYAYVDTVEEARRVFVENLTGTLQVIAKDAKIQVDLNPEVVARYRLLGYENRAVADEDFRNDEGDAGEVAPGSYALYGLLGEAWAQELTVEDGGAFGPYLPLPALAPMESTVLLLLD